MEADIEWKPVPMWEQYEVSNDGHVRRNGRVLRPGISKMGRYRVVTLSDKDRSRTFPINVLVLMAFVGPRPSRKHQSRHLDGNTENNALVNLAWGTAKQNAEDAIRLGRTTRGRIYTPQQRENIRLALTGRKLSPEHCIAMGAARKGHIITQETRDAISKARLGAVFSPEHRAALSLAARNRRKA